MPYNTVREDFVQRFLGVKIQGNISVPAIAAQVQERWHTFVLRPGGTSNFLDDEVHSAWAEQFGMTGPSVGG
jgi:hypothetical protein